MATIHDVAREAGCAISTVSRVLNGSPQTTEGTRKRVLQAIDTLGYHVNSIGRSLKTRQTRTIGVLIPSITNPVFASAVGGIEQAARQVGFDIVLTTSNYDPARETDAIQALISRGVEGMLLTVADPAEWPSRELLQRNRIPYVLLHNQPGEPSTIAAVSVDNGLATADLTNEVIRLGHSSIGYVSGAFGSSDRARIRYAGYREAMQQAGLKARDAVQVPFVGDDDDFSRALSRVLDSNPRPTALLCSNDLLAIRLIGAARAVGLSVPRDLSVAGFDGIDIGRMIEPSLATIVQPGVDMGKEAVALLFGLKEGHQTPRTIILPHQFRPGGSLALRRAEDPPLAEYGERLTSTGRRQR